MVNWIIVGFPLRPILLTLANAYQPNHSVKKSDSRQKESQTLWENIRQSANQATPPLSIAPSTLATKAKSTRLYGSRVISSWSVGVATTITTTNATSFALLSDAIKAL